MSFQSFMENIQTSRSSVALPDCLKKIIVDGYFEPALSFAKERFLIHSKNLIAFTHKQTKEEFQESLKVFTLFIREYIDNTPVKAMEYLNQQGARGTIYVPKDTDVFEERFLGEIVKILTRSYDYERYVSEIETKDHHYEVVIQLMCLITIDLQLMFHCNVVGFNNQIRKIDKTITVFSVGG